MRRRMAYVLLVLLMLAVPATALADGGSEEGRFVMGGNYVLPSGDTLIGDLVIMGGTARIEVESEGSGHGATFHLLIPTAKPAAEAA